RPDCVSKFSEIAPESGRQYRIYTRPMRVVRSCTAGGRQMEQQRRDFLGALLGAAAAKALAGQTRSGDMIYRTLGKTGERVSAIGIGGSHIGRPQEEQEAIRIIRSAIDRGITFMDNCWDYANGKCEQW